MVRKINRLLKNKRGSEAVGFLLTTAMLLCIFASIVTAFVYISQSYNAAYLCRKLTRQIEVSGQYDRPAIDSFLAKAEGDDLQNLKVEVLANYFSENKIQLCDSFTLKLTGTYKIQLVQLGSKVIELSLPIRAQVGGMSEVYWKP
ncbi:MAG: DUF4320 family protein [Oscillospiraceae bacterium]